MSEGSSDNFAQLVSQVREAGWSIQSEVAIDDEIIDIAITPLEATTSEDDRKIHIAYVGHINNILLSAMVETLPQLLPRDLNHPILRK